LILLVWLIFGWGLSDRAFSLFAIELVSQGYPHPSRKKNKDAARVGGHPRLLTTIHEKKNASRPQSRVWEILPSPRKNLSSGFFANKTPPQPSGIFRLDHCQIKLRGPARSGFLRKLASPIAQRCRTGKFPIRYPQRPFLNPMLLTANERKKKDYG